MLYRHFTPLMLLFNTKTEGTEKAGGRNAGYAPAAASAMKRLARPAEVLFIDHH
jgi:hypothetical protein